ncbi:hypothetical protein [Curtobacterium sp. MCBD17_021]|uniref:hypothetical protein n=1 Tax=Curtobacterium sp. MCBD17_021 TaxID=2175665 RepID=UPI0015E8BCFB|nr:hypothetical protein [Curtobacterium sp. MCBD17_021]
MNMEEQPPPRSLRREHIITDQFTSLSNAALRRIADRAEEIIAGRGEDGVFS